MPDWHCIGTNLVRKNPPITSVIVNFFWSYMVGVVFVRKVIHLATNFFGSTVVNHVLAELFLSYESVVDSQEVLLFSRNGARGVALSLYSS